MIKPGTLTLCAAAIALALALARGAVAADSARGS